MVARRSLQSARDAKRRRCATRRSEVSSRQASIASTNAYGSWAARSIAYNYRSAFFVTFDRSTRLNQAALKSLDASLAYNIYRGITLTADGVNLTNEKIIQFDTDRFRPRAVYDNGRYYFVGLRFQP